MFEEEAQITEVSISVNSGGKMQLKKYENSVDWGYSQSLKYAIPPHWTEEQIAEFRQAKTLALKDEVHSIAQQEVDDLYEQKKKMSE